jgi:hypothetical protein
LRFVAGSAFATPAVTKHLLRGRRSARDSPDDGLAGIDRLDASASR